MATSRKKIITDSIPLKKLILPLLKAKSSRMILLREQI